MVVVVLAEAGQKLAPIRSYPIDLQFAMNRGHVSLPECVDGGITA